MLSLFKCFIDSFSLPYPWIHVEAFEGWTFILVLVHVDANHGLVDGDIEAAGVGRCLKRDLRIYFKKTKTNVVLRADPEVDPWKDAASFRLLFLDNFRHRFEVSSEFVVSVVPGGESGDDL